MSNSEADGQKSASDVIGESSSLGEGSGKALSSDAGHTPASASALGPSATADQNYKSRTTNLRNDPTHKPPVYRPLRTSSAPPDEHAGDGPKLHFQPTKTHNTFVPGQDANRRQPYTSQQGSRQQVLRSRDDPPFTPPQGSDGGHSADSSVAGVAGTETPRSTTSSVNEGPISISTSGPPAEAGAQSPSVSSVQSQSSPVFPPGASRNYRQSSGTSTGNGSGNNSPGQGRDGPHGYRERDGPNRDVRTSGGRMGGRNNRGQSQQQQPPQPSPPQSFNNRGGPHMGAHDPMSRPGSYMSTPPPPMQQPPPPHQQPPQQQWYVDSYGNPIAPAPLAAAQHTMQYPANFAPPTPGGIPQGMRPPQPHSVMIPQQHMQQQQPMYVQQMPQGHMMPIFQQQYVVQQPGGQQILVNPQNNFYQANGGYVNNGHISMDDQYRQVMADGQGGYQQYQVQYHGGPIPVPVAAGPVDSYVNYQHPNHPQHVQMQQQMHQPQGPIYVSNQQVELGYGTPHHIQQMPMVQQVPQMGHMQQGAPAYQQQYPVAAHSNHQQQQPPQMQVQHGGPPQHYNQGHPRHGGGYQGNQRGPPPAPQQQHHHQSGGPHDPLHQQQRPSSQRGFQQPSHSTENPTTPATSTGSAATDSPGQAKDKEKVSDGDTASKAEPPVQAVTAAPVKDQTPVVAKERKHVLSYKKKDGSALDIQSFHKKTTDEATTAPVQTPLEVADNVSNSTTAPATTAPATTAPATTAPATTAPATTAPVTTAPETTVPVTTAIVASAGSEPNPEVPASMCEGKVNKAAEIVSEVDAVAEVLEAKCPVLEAVQTCAEISDAPVEVSVAPLSVVAVETVSDVAVPAAPVASLPTVREQFHGLQLSSVNMSTHITEDPAPTPAIKSADLPVSLTSLPVSGYSSQSSVASVDVPVVPAAPASTPIADNSVVGRSPAVSEDGKSKKMNRKELLARADAQQPSSDLSAYTNDKPTAGVAAPLATAPVSKSAPLASAVSNADSLPDSWDEGELNLPPSIVSTVEISSTKETSSGRSLRPGGKQGFSINLHHAIALIRFTKQEIMNLRPTERLSNPLDMYKVITVGEPSAAAGSIIKGGGSQWPKSQRSDARPQGQQDGDGWKRETNMPAPAVTGSRHRKSSSNAGPMPRKLITDPMVVLATETTAILNKITPQTFEKLSQSMLSLEVTNIAQMNKVIELIFEKAVQEQGFANLYAELCSFLNSKATHWAFYAVFRVVNEPTPESFYEYFWIKECNFPAVYAGPYFSVADCTNAMLAPTLPPMQPVSITLEPLEGILLNAIDLLVKIYRHDKSNSYYVTYMPFSNFSEEMRSQSTFADERSALKDAKNKNFFRAKLVTNCQTEFNQSTKNESMYSALEEEAAALNANKANISEADFFYKSAEIEDKRQKLKRRMLGNIRFVGELFKQKLLTDVTILDCISDLMGTPDNWKDMRDEQDIECLCHLLTTAGERLESKNATNPEAMHRFNLYFDRLRALTRDKTLNSRMRFAIEGVLSLRDNRWQKRRAQDGPLKITEIHRKMQAEQNGRVPTSAMPSQRQSSQAPRILSRGSGKAPSGQDVRRLSGGGVAGGDLSRTVSSSAYEQSSRTLQVINESHVSGRPNAGDPVRRTQSELSSGAGTPTSVGSGSALFNSSEIAGSHVRNPSERSIAEELDFVDKAMMNRAKSIVSEYLEQNDIAEVKISLQGSPRGSYGYFVLQVIDKALDAKKGPVVPSLIALLLDEQLGESMRAARDEVLEALRFCEEFKCLVDTTMDIKEAPEKFGKLLGTLVKAGVVTPAEVDRLAQDAHTNCLEELMSDAEESKQTFERFRRQFTAEL